MTDDIKKCREVLSEMIKAREGEKGDVVDALSFALILIDEWEKDKDANGLMGWYLEACSENRKWVEKYKELEAELTKLHEQRGRIIMVTPIELPPLCTWEDGEHGEHSAYPQKETELVFNKLVATLKAKQALEVCDARNQGRDEYKKLFDELKDASDQLVAELKGKISEKEAELKRTKEALTNIHGLWFGDKANIHQYRMAIQDIAKQALTPTSAKQELEEK